MTGSSNAFKISPGGTITEIIDATGDGAENVLDFPTGVALDAAGTVYLTGVQSDNAFAIPPATVVPALRTTGLLAVAALLLAAGIRSLRERFRFRQRSA